MKKHIKIKNKDGVVIEDRVIDTDEHERRIKELDNFLKRDVSSIPEKAKAVVDNIRSVFDEEYKDKKRWLLLAKKEKDGD